MFIECYVCARHRGTGNVAEMKVMHSIFPWNPASQSKLHVRVTSRALIKQQCLGLTQVELHQKPQLQSKTT